MNMLELIIEYFQFCSYLFERGIMQKNNLLPGNILLFAVKINFQKNVPPIFLVIYYII